MTNKPVLITGASSGFGKPAATRFHDEGWNVVTTLHSQEKQTELKQLDKA